MAESASFALAFGVEHPGGATCPLDIDLTGPVGVLGLDELVMHFAELGDIGLGGGRIARTGGATARAK